MKSPALANVSVRATGPVRPGITLIEVLIAIAVVAIGILGVVTLLPLGLHEAREGTIADRAAVYGRRAYREFKVRGMDRWDNWYGLYDPDTLSLPTSALPSDSFPPRKAFAIDPRSIAELGAGPENNTFPYENANLSGEQEIAVERRMPRISLQTFPRSGNMMSRGQANEIFICHDDLDFVVPDDDVGLPPEQQDELGNNTGNPSNSTLFGWIEMLGDGSTPSKRRATGDFSWMATVVPGSGGGDLFAVSIVVFYKRAILSTGRNHSLPPGELVVDAFVHSGIGGVDATLELEGVAVNSDGRARAEVVFDVRQDQWLMLANDAGTRFKWYRVARVGVMRDVGGKWQREVTLNGPDWTPAGNHKAVLVRGAVAVFEKTIHLETSSLWTQNEF